MYKQHKNGQHKFNHFKFMRGIPICLLFSFLLFNVFTSLIAAEKQTFEAEATSLAGGAYKVPDSNASGGYTASLTKPGDGIKFSNLSAAHKLAMWYASIEVGVISVIVNDYPGSKVNVHSSGSHTGSFLFAIIDVEIPVHATLAISMSTGDVALNIDQIFVGEGDLGLSPDIWNLRALPVATGPYIADWKGLSRIYTVPDWWREAKFGAWAHGDPQSMPEKGDWYARGIYMPGNWQYEFNLKNFGHPSEYGYKDICHNWVIDQWKPEELMDLYVEMGARYFMAMGVHHDNFDCWKSAYQPWNSVNVGMSDVWKWGDSVGGNCWRTTNDITDTWVSMDSLKYVIYGARKISAILKQKKVKLQSRFLFIG